MNRHAIRPLAVAVLSLLVSLYSLRPWSRAGTPGAYDPALAGDLVRSLDNATLLLIAGAIAAITTIVVILRRRGTTRVIPAMWLSVGVLALAEGAVLPHIAERILRQALEENPKGDTRGCRIHEPPPAGVGHASVSTTYRCMVGSDELKVEVQSPDS